MNVREAEIRSIREFMYENRGYLRGRVLDFGAGTQPYRSLVEGEYIAFERGDAYEPEYGRADAVMCNQVLQYAHRPLEMLVVMRHMLKPGGALVLTYPTSWTEIESNDFWRFTKAGMEYLLNSAGFRIVVHDKRAEVFNQEDRFAFSLGYGCVAVVREVGS